MITVHQQITQWCSTVSAVLSCEQQQLQIATADTCYAVYEYTQYHEVHDLMNKHHEWLHQLASMPSAANTGWD
eukprot:7894-Heterococcus_DN1.PRE.2